MGWLLTAYDVWARLTPAQRKTLETGTGTARPIAKLTELELWADGKPTQWGLFVLDSRRQEPLHRWHVDDEGNLYRIAKAVSE